MTENNPDGVLTQDDGILEDKLSKIRSQINSKLDNQKNLAIILSAVEENIDEQNNERTPVSYFVSFLALLDQNIRENTIVDQTLATTTAYFLDLVFPFSPKGLLKAKFGDILSKLALPLTSEDADAPLVRSTIGALESLLLAQEHQQWLTKGNISPKRALLGLLELCLDKRPKVRKRAQDAVQKLLMNPPPSPSPIHVAAPLCATVALEKLASLMDSQAKTGKKSANKELNSQIIHTLQLIKTITSGNAWPLSKAETLCDILLEISKTSDQFLVSAAFGAFEGLFESMSNIIDVEKFAKVLGILLDLKPSVNDTHLAAPWLAIIAKAFESFAKVSIMDCLKTFTIYIPKISSFLSSEVPDIYTSASQCLIAIVSQTVNDDILALPSNENGVSPEMYELIDEIMSFFAEHIEKELFSIKYQYANKEILEFITALIANFKKRCNPYMLDILETIGQWRTDESESYPNNKEAEDVLAVSIRAIGPEVLLGILPLNLAGGGPGRAWLLPLLRDNVSFSSLGFYKKEILPLVDFFGKKIEESSNKSSLNLKIFQTIVDQIWSLFPAFSDLPRDLPDAFDDQFASSISSLLYANVDMRVPVCNAFRILVTSNQEYVEGYENQSVLVKEEFGIEAAQKNLEYLASKASNILSVLFNVFSSTHPESRGFVLETINAYLGIIPKDDLEKTFNKVSTLLKDALDKEAQSNDKESSKGGPIKLSATMTDLVVAIAKYIPPSSYNALFSIFSFTVRMQDSLIQKRAYRIINRLAESADGRNAIISYLPNIEEIIIETTATTQNSARTTRLQTIEILIDLLTKTDLHFIPSILQEIILSVKDVNEKTRSAAFQTLIKMGYKMNEGGLVVNSKVPGFGEDAPTSESTLVEFFTMVSAGLAGQTQHMIAATINALSCLVYEFKSLLPAEVLLEISSTVELFLTHNSREIAKSAIGFVKVEVLSLPEEIVRNNLEELLAKLMRWSHEHKDHFKSKVKHIIERLIRKYGVEEIERAMPEEDKKLIANIKKARNRAKRKQDTDTNDANKSQKNFVSAYEDALYDSDVSDDEGDSDHEGKSSKKPTQFIMEGKEDPLNLLDCQALAHISSSKPKKFSKKDLSAKSDVPMKNGKLVFTEKDDDVLDTKGSGIDAYLDAIKQAPVKGQKNKLKFKKSKGEDDFSDSEDEQPAKKKNTAFKSKSKISKPKPKFKARKKF